MYAIFLILGALVVAVGGYRWYASAVDRHVIQSDPHRVTPAKMYMDGVDFMPTSKFVLFGYQFKSIAGAGPVVGAIIALQWGWLPAILWLFLGVLFIGWVHDYVAGMVSMRCDGLSPGGPDDLPLAGQHPGDHRGLRAHCPGGHLPGADFDHG